MKILCLLGLCLAPILTVQAAWYQVEIIVFEYLDPDPGDEIWYEDPGVPASADAIELLEDPPNPLRPIPHELEPEVVLPPPAPTVTPRPEPEVPTAPDPVTLAERFGTGEAEDAEPVGSLLEEIRIPYFALPKEQFRLLDVWRNLRASPDYKPLLQVAWQQEGQERGPGRAVFLEFPDAAESGPPVVAITGGADVLPAMDRILEGTVRVNIGRFMYVDVDLAYRPENLLQLPSARLPGSATADGTPVNSPVNHVRLTENRQIKLEELHYFDHPLFGMLVQVSRLGP